MKMNYLLIGLLGTFLSGCSKIGDPVVRNDKNVFIIKKGRHFAEGKNAELMYGQEIAGQVVFDSSAIYQTRLKENQADVNKLTGFSDCGVDHHQNSARLGWSWNGEAVAIYAYAYINGQRVIRYLDAFPLQQPINCSVAVVGDKYYFSAGLAKDSLTRFCTTYSGVRYRLYPYFGGDETAPHDITIRMNF